MRLSVGCPVYNRMWALPAWEDWILHACGNANVRPQFYFVGTSSTDGSREFCEERGKVIPAWEGLNLPPEGRQWDDRRYSHMAWLRNHLLREIRKDEPDLFLSIDSDILLHPKALSNLLETIENYDAVGGKCYLTPQPTKVPNYGQRTVSGGYRRPDTNPGVMKVDVLMALVLMTPEAYAVDYTFHKQGEDFGWSENARLRGLRFGFDSRLTSKHVMKPEALKKIDPRIGY